VVGGESSVNREAIEHRFTRAGWELDDSFSEYLIIGSNSDSLSILAYAPQAREPEDPVFELIDHERNLTSTGSSKYRPPQQASQLLQEHGGQPPEEDSDGDQLALGEHLAEL
jgi:hypothetical protein